jgi:hypothetical protein
MKNGLKILSLLVTLSTAAEAMPFSDFATEVIAVEGVFDGTRYRDPNAVLGKPALRCKNDRDWDPELAPTFRVKLAEAAYHFDLDNRNVIATIGPFDSITVKFDHKVVDYPFNPYNQDFIVFGNAFFQYNRSEKISDAVNLNTMQLSNPAMISAGQVFVSVSQGLGGDPNDPGGPYDPNDPATWKWYTFENGPVADRLFPTHAYRWDRQNACWTDDEMDFTKPVDPALQLQDFSGLTVAEAIELYDGSGGGTPFDLRDLPEYEQLAVDPETGYRWIQYVRFEGSGILWDMDGEVDAVADVAACGDPTHPYPVGDVNRDCRVDLQDLALLAGSWLQCTYKCP